MRFDGRAPRALLAFLLLLVVGCQTRGAVPMDSASLSPGAPSVRLFTEPEAGVQPVVQFIDAAQRSLDVAMYLLSNRSILTALASAQRRQVRVRVMLEEHPFGTGPGNQRSFAQLQAAGVAVAWGPPPFEFSHEKYAVSDGEVALVGTANWTAAAFASNREYLVEDRNATDVRQLSALFAADWGRSAPAVDDANLVVSPTNSRARLLALIQGARQQVSVESEELQDSQIEAALGQAAQRGVQVRVILPAAQQHRDPNESGRARLAAAGAAVRELAHPYIHGKDVVVDGRKAFVGSENFSATSLDQNREVGLLIGSRGPIQQLQGTFEQDWQAAR